MRLRSTSSSRASAGVNAQLLPAQLRKGSARTQVGKPQRRVDARERDQVCLRREMLEGVADRFEAFVVRQGVQVVENENELVPGRPDAV